jgi:hypothetical protein
MEESKNIDKLIANYEKPISIALNVYKNKYLIIYGDGTMFFKECFKLLGGKYTGLKMGSDTKVLCWIFENSKNVRNYLDMLLKKYEGQDYHLDENIKNLDGENELWIKFKNFNSGNYTECLTEISREFFS